MTNIVISVCGCSYNELSPYMSNKLKGFVITNYDKPLIDTINNIIGMTNHGVGMISKLNSNQYDAFMSVLNSNYVYIDYNRYFTNYINNMKQDINYIIYSQHEHEPLAISNIVCKNVSIKSYTNIANFIDDVPNLLTVDEVVDEITVDDEQFEQSIAPPTRSSYLLGKTGEQYIVELINSVRPMFETHIVANTGHLADIHVVDRDRHIKYIIEVKNKQKITIADKTKFDNDVKQAIADNVGWFVIGVFVSLVSNDIIGTHNGFVFSTDNKIYMPKQFVNKECFETIFTFMNTYKTINDGLTMKAASDVPESVYKLLDNLKNEYNDINITDSKYDDIIKNSEETANTVRELKSSLVFRKRFINQIITICYKTVPIDEDRMDVLEDDRFRQYINTFSSVSKFRKNEALAKFPNMKTKLAGLSSKQIYNKYKD